MSTGTRPSTSRAPVRLRSGQGKKLASTCALLLTGGLMLAGCGSSSSPPSAPSSVEGNASCLTEASKAATAAKAEVAMPAPDTIDMSKLAGKNVWMVVAAANPFSDAAIAGFKKAAELAGLSATVRNSNASVQTMNLDVQAAIDQGADGLILFSVSPEFVQKPLADLAAKGVPVVNLMDAGLNSNLADGVYAQVDLDYEAQGTALANWVLADSNCSASAAFLNLPVYPSMNAYIKAAQAEFARLCPECKQQSFEAAAGSEAADIQSQTQTAVQVGADYIFAPYDGATSYVEAGLAQTGKSAKVVSISGVAENLAQIAGDGPQVADYAYAPTAYIGWVSFAKLAQGMNGAPSQPFQIPARLVDKSNVGDGSPNAVFPDFADFESSFTHAWGLG